MSKNKKEYNKVLNESYFLNKDHSIEIVTRENFKDKYKEEEKVFLDVKPGITGYNQAYFRNSIDGAEKMRNDNYYAEHLSFWLDVKIVFKTIKTVLFRENINH